MTVPTNEASPQFGDAAVPTVTSSRTFTMPVWGGGCMIVPCPTWCTDDHRSDVEGGSHPTDLIHVSNEVSLRLAVNGESQTLLAGRIDQVPYRAEMRLPTVSVRVVPDAEMVEELTPADLGDVIGQLLAHVDQLKALQGRLVRARAEYEARCLADYEQRHAGQGVAV